VTDKQKRQYRGTAGPGSLASAILAPYSPYDVTPYDVTYDVMEIPITQPPTLRGTARVVSRVTAKPRVTLGVSLLPLEGQLGLYLGLQLSLGLP